MNVNILNRMVVAAAIGAVSLVGMSLPTHARQQPQEDQKQQEKQKKEQPPAQKQRKQDQNKQQQQHAKQQQQDQNKQQQQHAKQQQRTQNKQEPQHSRQQQVNRPSQQGQRVQQAERRGVWQQHRASSWQSEHRTWQQRGGYNGYRIPDVRFRGYFGSGHGFRIHSLPLVIVSGYPRFQYGGYWFSLIDPWPEYWSDNWYDNDDVYIDYSNDGYYLYNRRHPGVGIAISVYLH
ncbi:MAG: hypothetical protein LAO21_17710 [Acidobacteriia bacterium]|nr:hypothetical protein [Terriglobia bacterium]